MSKRRRRTPPGRRHARGSQGRPLERRARGRKHRYRRRLEVELARVCVLNLYGDAKNIYRCRFCHGWHLGGHG